MADQVKIECLRRGVDGVRGLAVHLVDLIHGFTCEFAPDPAYHAAQYDHVEDVVRECVGMPPVNGYVD